MSLDFKSMKFLTAYYVYDNRNYHEKEIRNFVRKACKKYFFEFNRIERDIAYFESKIRHSDAECLETCNFLKKRRYIKDTTNEPSLKKINSLQITPSGKQSVESYLSSLPKEHFMAKLINLLKLLIKKLKKFM